MENVAEGSEGSTHTDSERVKIWGTHKKLETRTIDKLLTLGFSSMEALALLEKEDLEGFDVPVGQVKLLIRAVEQTFKRDTNTDRVAPQPTHTQEASRLAQAPTRHTETAPNAIGDVPNEENLRDFVSQLHQAQHEGRPTVPGYQGQTTQAQGLHDAGRSPRRRPAETRNVGASADLIPKTRRTSTHTSQDGTYLVPHAQAAFPDSSPDLPQYRSVPCTSTGYLYRMDDGELERISEERDGSDSDDDENLANGEQSVDEFHLVQHRPGRPLPSLPTADPHSGQMNRRQVQRKHIPLSASRHPHLTFAVVLVVVATILGAVYTLTSFNRKHHLEIQVPEDLQIRQIRSYSRDRTLDVVSLERDVSRKTSVHLYDMRECHNELPKCKAFAVCDAFMKNYKCRCRNGYYASEGKCKACSTRCPEGSFMTSPCMEQDDVVCTPCTLCTGIQYEAAPCSTAQDTLCIDVTFPAKGLLQSRSATVDLDTENGLGDISVSSSPNCFIEKLGKLQDFDSPLYFTANQQKMGLTFQRPSGMEIEVRIRDLFLLPEYRDLDHLGDNPYIRHSFRSTEEEKKALDHAVKSFCRNPVPDSYHLGLNIIADRTTAASVITCDSHNASLPHCPETYTDGKKYLYRSLNKNCSNSGHGVTELKQLPNSIVCTDDNTLLLSAFKIQSKPARMRRFPSADCAQANKECNHCIKTHTNCLNTSFSECCQVSCYSHDSCYKSYSKDCPAVPVECATGDVYLFTLEPNIRSLSNRFQCHLKRRDVQTMYQVEYSVFLPGINYHLHPRQKNVTMDTSKPGFRSKGSFVADYLTLNHNIHMDVPDEVIATGTYENSTVDRDITMYPLKTPSSPLSGNYDIVNPKEGSFLMSVQFEKPFTYSSSSWWNNGCRKNISKMFSAESIYDSKNPVAVKATIDKVGGMFQYHILPRLRKLTPVIRLSIPGNQSVLSSYRDEGLATSLNSSALTAHLTRDWTRTVWIIQITGRLTVCPGYLSLEVHDKCSGKRLGRFDIMVDCPLDFSFVFDIPQKYSATFPAAFAVRITDMAKTYQFFLLSFQRPSFLPINQDVARITVSDHMSPWKPALAIVFLMIAALMLCTLVYVCMSRRKRASAEKKIKDASVGNDKNSTPYLNVHDLDRIHGNTANLKARRTMPASRFVSVFFIILYIIYSFLLTFTALFGLVYLGIKADIHSILNSTRVKDDILNNFTHELHSMSRHESTEISRLLNLTIDRHRACSVHLDQELDRIFDEIQNGSHIQMQIWESGSKHLKEALSKLVVTQASTYNKTLHEFLLKYNETLSYRMNNVFTRYKTYLDKVGRSSWIKFPKMLYRMFIKESRPRGFQKLDGSPGLVQWLGVDKIMDVVMNQENIRNRLFRDFPKIKGAEFSLSSWITESMFTQTQMYNLKKKPVIRNHLLKFITVENVTAPRTESKSTIDTDTLISVTKTTQTVNNLSDTQTADDAEDSSFEPLFYDVLITSLCVFLICDVILLAYRFLWMCQMHANLKYGFSMPLPLDQVSYHIFKTQTGRYPSKFYAAREHLHTSDSNNDSTWASGDMYFFPQNVPKAKEDILRQIWSYKKSLQPLRSTDKKKAAHRTNCCASLWRWFCRIATNRVTWKFIICALTICVICAILVFVDTFVTMDTVKYVFSANMLVPQLETHLNMTNGNLDNQARHLNIYLSDLNDQIDEEVRDINRLLEEMISHQGKLWHNLVEHACVVIEKSNTTPGQCDLRQYSLALTSTLMSCNFLPIAAQPYIGIQSGAFEELINSELFPLAEIMRNKLFYASYLVILYTAIFLLFHVICELVFKYLLKQSLVPVTTVFNTAHGVASHALELQESNSSNKELANHNALWTAASQSESGVYTTDTNNSSHKESNV